MVILRSQGLDFCGESKGPRAGEDRANGGLRTKDGATHDPAVRRCRVQLCPVHRGVETAGGRRQRPGSNSPYIRGRDQVEETEISDQVRGL